MPNEGIPAGGAQIRAHLQEVADALDATGHQHAVIMVGGSLLAWHELGKTTRDVDSLRRLAQSAGVCAVRPGVRLAREASAVRWNMSD